MTASLQSLIVDQLHLSPTHYARFVQLAEVKILAKKEFLLQSGQVCRFIGIVEDGVLRSFREKDGEEYISDFYVAHSFATSYRSFLNQEPSVGSIQALTPSRVLLISYDNFNLLLNESADWYKFGKHIGDTLFIKKCVKETSLLMDSALERYCLLLATYPHIEQYVSQYNIASYLGIKPESLSRIKSLNIHQGK